MSKYDIFIGTLPTNSSFIFSISVNGHTILSVSCWGENPWGNTSHKYQQITLALPLKYIWNLTVFLHYTPNPLVHLRNPGLLQWPHYWFFMTMASNLCSFSLKQSVILNTGGIVILTKHPGDSISKKTIIAFHFIQDKSQIPSLP